MTTYIYLSGEHAVNDIAVLGETLIDNGALDGSSTLDGDMTLTVITATGSQLQVDTAVSEASMGGLKAAKVEKINAVLANSKLLLSSGFSATIGAKTGQFCLDQHNCNYGYFESLLSKYTRTPGILPFQIMSSDGKVINITTPANITKLANSAFLRIQYIYFDQANGDGSLGESGYIIAIRAATTVAQVDAIIDIRV